MDLRRIVEEVEERKREEYAYAPAPKPRAPGGSGGLTASILETVRDRMLREDPGADVSSLSHIIEPAHSTPPPAAPHAKLAGEPAVVTVAREAARSVAQAKAAPAGARKPRDDFLARYLVMSEEFEKRYKVKGWTDTVRKKCSSNLRH